MPAAAQREYYPSPVDSSSSEATLRAGPARPPGGTEPAPPSGAAAPAGPAAPAHAAAFPEYKH